MGAPLDEQPGTAAEEALFAAVGLPLSDERLRSLALTHPSHAREQECDPLESNERLELLGDAVIQLAVSELLYRALPDRSEGELTRIRSFIVRGSQLAAAAERLGLGSALRLGRGADLTGARGRASVLACGLEAIAGALFLEHGFTAAGECLTRLLEPEIRAAIDRRHRNWKGDLQELTQADGGRTPEYRLTEQSGPSHAPRFAIEAWLGEELLGRGHGASKKDAEQAAAEDAVRRREEAATSAGEPALSEGTRP